MRVFLAVHPGEDFCAALSSRLDEGARRLPLRWTGPATWHLTLQFLGEWPGERLEALQRALPGAADRAPHRLRPGGLGAFPNLSRPRVLFLHMEDDGRTAALARDLRSIVAATWPEGPQDTRPLRAHLTLARVKAPLDGATINTLRGIDLSGLPEVMVDGFALVASELGAGGPQHRDLGFWRMRKKGE